MPERKIGELFEYDGHTLKCEEEGWFMCEGCFFNKVDIVCNRELMNIIGPCNEISRSDKTNVIFKLIK